MPKWKPIGDAVRVLGVSCVCTSFICVPAYADNAILAEPIRAITDAADRICGNVATSGNSQDVRVNGDVKAEIAGLLKKLTNLSGSVSAEIETKTYNGLAQEALPAALKDIRDCKLKSIELLTALIQALTRHPDASNVEDERDCPPRKIADRADAGSAIREQLHSYCFVDAVVTSEAIWVLGYQPTKEKVLYDPDGTKYSKRKVSVIKVAKDGVITFRSFATVALGGVSRGTIDVNHEVVTVFMNYKRIDGGYGMDGTLYRFNAANLIQTAGVPIFSDQNWGWYPKIIGDRVEHFSYDGYRKIVDTEDRGPEQPEAAYSRFFAEQNFRSLGIFPTDDSEKAQERFIDLVLRHALVDLVN